VAGQHGILAEAEFLERPLGADLVVDDVGDDLLEPERDRVSDQQARQRGAQPWRWNWRATAMRSSATWALQPWRLR